MSKATTLRTLLLTYCNTVADQGRADDFRLDMMVGISGAIYGASDARLDELIGLVCQLIGN